MQFEREPDRFTINLDESDMRRLVLNGTIGDRIGVFHSDSKVTIRTPRYRDERDKWLYTALAGVIIDPGQDITVIMEPHDLPASGFIQDIPKTKLIEVSAGPDVTEAVFPDDGLRIMVRRGEEEPRFSLEISQGSGWQASHKR